MCYNIVVNASITYFKTPSHTCKRPVFIMIFTIFAASAETSNPHEYYVVDVYHNILHLSTLFREYIQHNELGSTNMQTNSFSWSYIRFCY